MKVLKLDNQNYIDERIRRLALELSQSSEDHFVSILNQLIDFVDLSIPDVHDGDYYYLEKCYEKLIEARLYYKAYAES